MSQNLKAKNRTLITYFNAHRLAEILTVKLHKKQQIQELKNYDVLVKLSI